MLARWPGKTVNLEGNAVSGPSDSQAPIRLIIADDQTLFREGLCALLTLEPHLEVAGVAADGAQVLEMLCTAGADILLLNPDIPAPDGRPLLDCLSLAGSTTKTIVLTDSNYPRALIEPLAKGAAGVVVKRSNMEQLKQAIDRVHAGRIWLDPGFVDMDDPRFIRDSSDLIQARLLWKRLSPREREIASLFAAGHRYADIASALAIREGTVRSHLHRIYMKLRISSRRQLVVYELYSRLEPALMAFDRSSFHRVA
jgi:DNA-binding NarL/FixJ family response regulator